MIQTVPPKFALARRLRERGVEVSDDAVARIQRQPTRQEDGDELPPAPPNIIKDIIDAIIVWLEDHPLSDLFGDGDGDGEPGGGTPPKEETTPPASTPEPTRKCVRRAVCVGINGYATSPLKNCVNDALCIRRKLIDEFGFEPKDIALLTENAATKAKILAAVSNMVKDLKPGDVAVFFYAGHGTQEADDSFDEPDFLDEALVPIDVDSGGRIDYSKLLIDDELRAIFDAVSQDVNLCVMLDSCHSGTGIRQPGPGEPPVRRFPASPHVKVLADAGILVAPAGRAFITPAARHVLLSACKPEQTASDGAGSNGLFTTHLLVNLRKGRTYRQVHAAVAPAVKRARTDQEPTIEGAGVGRTIFECLRVRQWF